MQAASGAVPPANERDKTAATAAKEKHEAASREPDSLDIWTRDAKLGYVRRARICTRYLDAATGRFGQTIAGILPLKAPSCLIISGEGAGFRLNLDKAALSSLALQISPAPPSAVGSENQISQDTSVLMSLLSQAPASDPEGAAMCKELFRDDKDLSPAGASGNIPAERLRLAQGEVRAIRRLREYLERKKPRVLHVNLAIDDDLLHIDDLPSLESLDLKFSQITDAGLAHLQGAGELQELGLGNTSATGAGLVYLKKLTKLRRLDLSESEITDDGLTGIKGLTQLKELDLARTKITDAGLESLKRLTRLQRLHLGGTHVTAEGLRNLQRALPNCKFAEPAFW